MDDVYVVDGQFHVPQLFVLSFYLIYFLCLKKNPRKSHISQPVKPKPRQCFENFHRQPDHHHHSRPYHFLSNTSKYTIANSNFFNLHSIKIFSSFKTIQKPPKGFSFAIVFFTLNF